MKKTKKETTKKRMINVSEQYLLTVSCILTLIYSGGLSLLFAYLVNGLNQELSVWNLWKLFFPIGIIIFGSITLGLSVLCLPSDKKSTK